MENVAPNGTRAPLGDYRSALAKAKLLAVEESKQRSRQRLPGSQRLSTEARGRAKTSAASIPGHKHRNTIKLPPLQDRPGAVVVKQELEIERSTATQILESSGLEGASKANHYAGLVPATKRKREEQSSKPAHTTLASAAEESQALPNRPFAPLKKPVRGARPPYRDV